MAFSKEPKGDFYVKEQQMSICFIRPKTTIAAHGLFPDILRT